MTDQVSLPNVKKIFSPDPGMIFFDLDLDRADLQVVVWECDDAEFKQALRDGTDIHALNAKALFNLSGSLDEIKKQHKPKRGIAKRFCHGTNYGGSARTMAITCGITIKEAEAMQKRWFEAHPGILAWHRRTESALMRTRTVTNKFGYRRFYFDRPDSVLPEALAWVPQSTVAIVINTLWCEIEEKLGPTMGVEIQAQVHDSLAGQFPVQKAAEVVQAIQSLAAGIVIPYDDPLVIPCGIKTSQRSWGEVS